MYRFKIFFWQSPTDYSEGDLPKETRTKVRLVFMIELTPSKQER